MIMVIKMRLCTKFEGLDIRVESSHAIMVSKFDRHYTPFILSFSLPGSHFLSGFCHFFHYAPALSLGLYAHIILFITICLLSMVTRYGRLDGILVIQFYNSHDFCWRNTNFISSICNFNLSRFASSKWPCPLSSPETHEFTCFPCPISDAIHQSLGHSLVLGLAIRGA